MKTFKLLLATLLVNGLSFESKSQTFVSDDITTQVVTSGNHDSTICATIGSVTYQVMIENSYLNDTCKLKDQFSGQVMFQDVNTTGQNPWFVTVPGYTESKPDQFLVNNMAIFNFQPVKITTLHDTLFDITGIFEIPVTDACSYGMVDGRVYVDMNGDCAYNTGDLNLNDIWVHANPTVTSTFAAYYTGTTSAPDGTYSLNVQQSWLDYVDITIPSYLSFIFPPSSCSPGMYTFTTVPQSNVDFALQCTSNVDVEASIGSNGVVRPNIPFTLHPKISNTGCDAASGTMKLVLDPDVVYDASQSSNPATSVNGDTLYWNYSNLTNLSNGGYWNSFFAGIHLTPTLAVNIGDTLCFKVISNVPAADLDPSNNIAEICLPVVNSYDPNIKEVNPKGEGPEGIIPMETEKLKYTIHFQNTGNAVAYNIYILDTLSANVIPSSVKILGASHQMTPEWNSSSVLKFNFFNIMLADSNSNEPASHGFVTFEVDVADGIALGETIENTAHIYFDFNEAIVTNTALNTFGEVLSTGDLAAEKISLQPNPATDKVKIVAENVTSVKVIDFSGKTVIETAVLQDQLLNISGLQNGMYIVQVSTAKGQFVEKLLISK